MRPRLDTSGFLRAAVLDYRYELRVFMSYIESSAKEAGLQASDYIPREIQSEDEHAEGCLRIIELATADDMARFTGSQIRAEHGGVFHAALLLKREQLIRLRAKVRMTPLAPQEAQRPLNDRIQEIDNQLAQVWVNFPVSSCFDLVRTRWAVRQGGIGWQPLIRWLAAWRDSPKRAWCFCDTNFFLESRHIFSQVDWHTVWALPKVVLVVPQAMLRELDDFKVDPRKERSRRRQRASKVLQILESTAEATPAGTPAPLRPGVEVLILDYEPAAEIESLDPHLADDRLIAAALDFREHVPEEHVVLVSDDRGPRFKARRYGLERRDLSVDQR